MNCRICGSEKVEHIAIYRPYIDYEAEVLDCHSCGCRFVNHDPNAHELLHANPSNYDLHAKYGKIAEDYFSHTEIKQLKTFLSSVSKNKFVIDFIDKDQSIAKVAEIGCSRGYLASYFIATKRDTFGFDISETAVKEATRAFGDHFYIMTDEALHAHSPFDAIFHVGTIGCVASPVEMTHKLLSWLKPGGWLLFNAPNKKYVDQTKSLWLSTPPPDLVTIFPRQFWNENFRSVAEVQVMESFISLYDVLLQKIGNKSQAMSSGRLVGKQRESPVPNRTSVIKLFYRVIALALRVTLGKLSSSTADPYGIFVIMKKKPTLNNF